MGYPYEGWRPDPYGAHPMTGYGQNQYMPQMQGQTGQMAAQSPFTMVPTIADVDKVSVQPGETKWIMVQSDPIFAVKTANAMGYAPAEYYRFEQIDPAGLTAPVSVPAVPQLTREDVEKIVEDKASVLFSQYSASLAPQASFSTSVKSKKEAAQ